MIHEEEFRERRNALINVRYALDEHTDVDDLGSENRAFNEAMHEVILHLDGAIAVLNHASNVLFPQPHGKQGSRKGA
ncbi:hypothetical protein [Microbacterium amylolyticum]|uniref:Uncharacterized protein n=1 Tax=Microbacterium amylolyticum TaxID=936337 RepID=A0ABS4ZIY9_9MICO|nr:hypothetical protein [Microbacterium amylolyticum]MBP2437247.1 hypothetical protein [Microbacterium amylolyticum]